MFTRGSRSVVRRIGACGVTVAACLLAGAVPAAAETEAETEMVLANAGIRVEVSSKTGQVLRVADPRQGGKVFVADNHDIRRVDGVDCDETDDVVTGSDRAGDALTLTCTNRKLPGLRIRKVYSLQGEVLSKKARYECDGAVRLFEFHSAVVLDAAARAGGHYYQPMDTGYEVSRYDVYRPAATVTSDHVIRFLDAGFMAFYQPATDRTVAQYRIRRDGRIIGPTFWTTNDAKWTKDGWEVSFGAAFLGEGQPAVELESHIALVNGDPRGVHRRIWSEPEFRAWASSKPPDWLGDVQLDVLESIFRDYLPSNTTWWVHKTLPLEVPYIAQGQYMILIMSDWSNYGYCPYKGPIRYRTGGEMPYTGELTPEDVRETIRKTKAISPKIKVALYSNPASISTHYPGQWEGSIKDAHPDWIMYNKDGTPRKGEPGAYRTNIRNQEYREVLLDQYAHMVDYYGVDMFYLDYGGLDDVDWGPPTVVSQADCTEFLHQVADVAREKGVPIWTNGLANPTLVSDLGIFELGPASWDPSYEADWRRFAAAAGIAKINKAMRPSAMHELMYPGFIPYYNMVMAYGLTCMGVNQTRGMSQATARLTFERVGNLLRDTRAAEVRVHPDWWRLETKDLETAVLKQGDAYILPVIWHRDEPTTQTVSVTTADMKLSGDNYLFAWGSHVTMPYYRSVYQAPGWAEEVVAIDGFQALGDVGDLLGFQMQLAKDEVHHLVLTQVPGFVYSMSDQRAYLLLPDAVGVRIAGSLPKKASKYTVAVESRVDAAQILLYVPSAWDNVAVVIGGRNVVRQAIRHGNGKFVLVDVARGAHTIVVTDRGDRWRPEDGVVELANPTMNAWKVITDFFPTMTGEAKHSVYQKDGHNCLEIVGKSGSFMLTTFALHATHRLNPEGIEFLICGRGVPGDSLAVVVGSNQWRHPIDAGFSGWKRLRLRREDFTPVGDWDEVSFVTFDYRNGGQASGKPKGLVLADLRFIPPAGWKPGEELKRRTSGAEGPFRTWNVMPK